MSNMNRMKKLLGGSNKKYNVYASVCDISFQSRMIQFWGHHAQRDFKNKAKDLG